MSDLTDEKTEQQVAVNVPLFLKKLWKMVNDKEAEDIIGWNSTGDGFIIHDPIQFITKLLPHYFKHNNLASFVRQLNFYDFHKVASIDRDEMQFAHHYFLKDLPETLVFITRKCPNVKPKLSKELKEEDVHNLLHGVKELKGKHTLVDKELKLLKQENAALWNEINCLRVKYAKQTKIINKLIHFLVSYIHSHQNQVFNKQTPGVTRKNISKNLKASPSLLEIDYKDHKNKLKVETENNQSVRCSLDSSGSSNDSQEQLCSKVLENMMNAHSDDVNLPYSVQFPKSPNRRPSEDNVTGYKKDRSTSRSHQLIKLAELNDSNTLKEIYQTYDPVTDKEVMFSINYPHIQDEEDQKNIQNTKVVESTQSTSTNSTEVLQSKRLAQSNILGDIFQISEADDSPTPSKQPKLILTNTTSILSNKDGDSLPDSATQNAMIDEQFLFEQLPDAEVPLNEILLDPNIVANIQTIPAQSKDHLEFDIRENPKQKFGQYVDSTQSEINTLQDVLTNFNPKELATIFQDLTPMPADAELVNMCDAMIEDTKDEPENNNLKEIKQELVNELAHMPGGSGGSGGTVESLENEDIVDEYFNDDFGLVFSNDDQV